MTSITWKSAEILKVDGTTIREGTFTGSKIYSDGVKTPDSPTTFTPAKIAKIYENITTHVPIYVGHSTEANRRAVGYAYKFGVTETLDDIKYNGFVFDRDSINRIVASGYDKVSPELSPDGDRLLAIAFVPNPAISGTDADMEIKLFSKPADGNSEGNMTEAQSTTEATPAATTTGTVPQTVNVSNVAPSVTQEHVTELRSVAVPDVSALVSQVEEYRTKYEQAVAKNDTLLEAQYKGVLGEVRALGINDPEGIVRNLPVDQKISVLSKMKESIAAKKPLASPTESTTEDTKKEVDRALDEVLKELGVSKEEYAKITGKR